MATETYFQRKNPARALSRARTCTSLLPFVRHINSGFGFQPTTTTTILHLTANSAPAIGHPTTDSTTMSLDHTLLFYLLCRGGRGDILIVEIARRGGGGRGDIMIMI